MQFTAEMIAGLLNGTIVGDKNATVSTVSSIDGGKAGSLAYLTNPKYEQYVYTTEASIVLVDSTFEPKEEVKTTLIKVENVGACVLNLLEMYNATRIGERSVSLLHFRHTVLFSECWSAFMVSFDESQKHDVFSLFQLAFFHLFRSNPVCLKAFFYLIDQQKMGFLFIFQHGDFP